MKYRKVPVVIDATQWFKNGDHPEDGTEVFVLNQKSGVYEGQLLEGKAVQYYRHPRIDGQDNCNRCGDIMHNHGWIDTSEGGHIVCPGDYIITGVFGERYPCKPNVFAKTYEKVGP